jgi:hypothetical protein
MDISHGREVARGKNPPGGPAVERLRLGQALVRSWWPFWQFKDASRGDLYARAAAHQHNLRMRANLPRYLLRWFVVCCLASAAICACDALAADVRHRLDLFVLMAAGSGIVCAYAVCALFVIGYAYLRLRHGGS